jgi:hypothetical protein
VWIINQLNKSKTINNEKENSPVLEQIEAQLKEAVQKRADCQSALNALPEFQRLIEAEQVVKNLNDLKKAEVDRLNAEKVEQVKEEIIKAGFEVRKGHSTSSTNHKHWQSDEGEPWTVLIVHNSRPEVRHVSESSTKETFSTVDKSEFQEQWLLGHGETEEEAWENAIESWNDEETRAAALVQPLSNSSNI